MLKKYGKGLGVFAGLSLLIIIFAFSSRAAHAVESTVSDGFDRGMTLWQLLSAGGTTMIFLLILSVISLAMVIYHFVYVTPAKLVPLDFSENLMMLLEKKDYDKVAAMCRQQSNLVSAIAVQGLKKVHKSGAAIEDAIQNEGKARIEALWQNLSYLGDAAVIAPLLGLLGTIIGMINAFSFFRSSSINPIILTQGLAKAMVNTAVGLVIAVICLAFYAYFRGRIIRVTSEIERVATEMVLAMKKS